MSEAIDKGPTAEKRLANVCVVLKEPAFPANIGSAARAMKNMGLTDLRVVNPPRDRNGEAFALAQGGIDLVERMQSHRTLREAIADCGIVIGATARKGGWRKRLSTPKEVVAEAAKTLAENRVAIVFGPEDRGLANEDIIFCTHLVKIPTSPMLSSLNVSQAVLILAYEMFMAVYAEPDKRRDQPKAATRQEIEGMFDHLREALREVGFFSAGNEEYFMLDIRRMFNRREIETSEATLMRGIARQILWFTRRGKATYMREFLENMTKNG